VDADPAVPAEVDHSRLFTSPYGAPWPRLIAACLSRAVTLEWRRNWPATVVRWLITLVLSLVAGSIFWRLPTTFSGAVSFMGMLFWVLCSTMVLTVPTVELTYYRRPIMLQQRANHFYAGWMEAVPQVRRVCLERLRAAGWCLDGCVDYLIRAATGQQTT
jgi:hypothetical protein